MGRFIAVQTLPAKAGQDELIEMGKALANGKSDGALWLRSWVVPGEERVLSEWDASEEEDVRAALEAAGLFPVEAIHVVGLIEPEWFRE